jgi:hypothetical protein
MHSLAALGFQTDVYISSTDRLAARLRAGEDTISFDKDDDDTLDFVTAAANLRSFAYTIERKTRWEVKGQFSAIFWYPRHLIVHFLFRNGWEHHPSYSYNKRGHIWPHRLTSPSPPPEIL